MVRVSIYEFKNVPAFLAIGQHQLYSVIGIITDVRLNLLCFGRSADPLDDGRRNCHTYTRPCAKISWDHHAPL